MKSKGNALEGVMTNLFSDADELRAINDGSTNAITVGADNGGFTALRSETPKPRVSMLAAAAVDVDRDSAADASRKMSAAAILMTFLQFAALPVALWRGVSRLITGSNAVDNKAGAFWLTTLPEQLRSIYGLSRIALTEKATNLELWNAATSIWNTIKDSKTNTCLRIIKAASTLEVHIGVQGLRSLWQRGWYVAPYADGELANKGGQDTTVRYNETKGVLTMHSPTSDEPLGSKNMTRSNVIVLMVMAGFDSWDTMPKALQTLINKGVHLDFTPWFLASLMSVDVTPGSVAGSQEASAPNTSAGDALAISSDLNFRATLVHFLNDVIDIIESTVDDQVDASLTINAAARFIGELTNDDRKLSEDDIKQLRDQIEQHHLEMGGLEEGFIPLLMAAAPLLAGAMSGGGGKKRGGGGFSGIMDLVKKLPLGSILFGGKSKQKEKEKKQEADPDKFDDNSPLTVGALKLLLRGLNSPQKEVGAYLPDPAAWEDAPGSFSRVETGLLEGLLLGSLLKKRGKKKKKKRGGPAPIDPEQSYEARREREDERERRRYEEEKQRDEDEERKRRLQLEEERRLDKERELSEREAELRALEREERVERARDESLGFADAARTYEDVQRHYLPAPHPDASNPALADMYGQQASAPLQQPQTSLSQAILGS